MRDQGIEVNANGPGVTLPANFPTDVPVYSGFKAMAKTTSPTDDTGSVSFMGKGDLAAIAAFYEKEMTAKGWKQEQATATGETVMQTYTKENRNVSIVAGGDKDNCSIQVVYKNK